MKKTNNELFIMLRKLNGIDSTANFSVKVSYKIIKNRMKIADALRPFEETRDEIITKYSNGKGSITSADPGYADAVKDIDTIGNEPVDVEGIETISIDDLPTDVNVPFGTMDAISFMIKELNNEPEH